ncbi:MAG: hypothetical protein M1840_006411 [Geoglossum simile]|nr:MAG: hypothetical protein M1840_006411 [Geoglossum simile]
MSTQELWDLAIIVTGNIARVAADTAQTSLVGQARLRSTSALYLEKIRMMTLGVLAAKLIEVQFTLENPQSSQEKTISRRLPRLLAQLEEVCTWPVKPSINERHNSRDTETVKFPALRAVLQPSPGTRSALRIALADFASSGGPKERKFCANLDGFAGAHGTRAQIPNASACVDRHQVEQIVSPKEYPSLVNELINDEFYVVQKHWARLRLTDKVRPTQEDVLFDVLFSAAPASLSQAMFMRWQHLRFQVQSGRSNVRNIPASEGSLEQEQTKVIEVGHFRDLLGILPKSSKEWMEWTMNTGPFGLALRFRKSSQTRRVRIAILDTGYDSKSPFFYPASRRKRLIMWRDFAEGTRDPVDRDGHGTHVLSLAMKVAPAADICVARVATNSDDLGKASRNISEAIEWAAETAEAEVISMLFGFSDEPEVDDENVISNAIAQALAKRNQRILFFAAAANDGGNQIEMFPVRHPSVFSVRATDHQGTFLTLNPPPDFSGVDVPAAALSCQRTGPGEVCKTGTSAATLIAAGITATVLGYARLRLEEETKLDPNTVRSLCTERLMLLQLSRKMGEKQYYLCAENFIRQSE